ncbi:propanediol utilization protein [Patescibacteria group bacterium]|nr:propanediol utilization protein [Patescibacteria group bacterium]MBU0964149.1 propanediol utilization protein [Patescibacteria group bacterium]
MKVYKVPIEVSARHIHLSATDAAILFGQEYEFNKQIKISQPTQYAAVETVEVIGLKNSFKEVRVILPFRQETQLEISITDGYYLGIKPRIAVSGNLVNSAGGVVIKGPQGQIDMKSGVIAAKRHLHISPVQGKEWGIKHMDVVSVKVAGERSLIFHNVIVRSRKGIDKLSFMLDTDEANAAGVKQGDEGELIVN